MTRRAPLALVGPTASGKSDAAVTMAPRLGAEIVSVDSMLVYRGMDVGTAKPGREDRDRVIHHLIDVADPAEPFSVVRYQALARAALDGIAARGARALLVGGTGLYYRAVVDGLEFPGTSSGTRGLLAAEAAAGPERLYRRLASFDPAAAHRIQPANTRRTVRALEVAAITGRAYSSFAGSWDRYDRESVRAAGVELPRPVLHRRIEARVEGMLPGLLAETRLLLEAGFGTFLTSAQAIGYAEAVAVLEGSMGPEEAAVRTARRTKALARRQMGWFRRDPRIRWFTAGEGGAVEVADGLVAYLGSDDSRRIPRSLTEVGA